MFMVSYVTAISSEKESEIRFKCIEVSLCLFGIAFSIIQFLLTRSISFRLRKLRSEYLVVMDPIFLIYDKGFRTRLGPVQTVWIPVALAIVWIVMLVVAVLPANLHL